MNTVQHPAKLGAARDENGRLNGLPISATPDWDECGSENRTRVPVIYIAGENRSGTTLLIRVIGAHQGCVPVGELFDFWDQWREGSSLCGCGSACRDCAFWNDVLEDAFGPDGVDADHVTRLVGSVQRAWHLPFLLLPWLRTDSYQRRLEEFVSILERLYVSIQRVSGCDVIVDSSKFGVYALALAESPRLDVRVVHMIRDSRACAFSWQRVKRKPTAGDRVVYMPRRSIWRTAVIWNARNWLLSVTTRRFTRSTSVLYEDFVRRPEPVVRGVMNQLGLGRPLARDVRADGAIAMPPNHIFAGNPDRMKEYIRIRPDDEWRSKMPVWQQRIVFVLTLPILWKLGYLRRERLNRVPDTDFAMEKSSG